MTTISLEDFRKQMVQLPQDEVIIDVRTALEHRGCCIQEAKNIPLDTLDAHAGSLKHYKKVYLICASGNRSGQAQKKLAAHGIQSVSVQGGMQAWEQSGLPVSKEAGVIPVIRQVFIVAGVLILTGTILSQVVASGFVYIAMFVGAGLLFSGVSGWCGMAKLLELMPWNKVKSTGTSSAAMQPCCSVSNCQIVETLEETREWTQERYTISQFVNQDLAHYSYAIVSNGSMAVVDPARDPEPYYEYAKQKGATITAVFETHPHADFVSAHAEIAETTGATIFVSPLLGADYPHTAFSQGSIYTLGSVVLTGLDTPGHSPDSISLLLEDAGKPVELFSGDTLFVGDVGRPDLREAVGNITAQREELAGMMYETVEYVLKPLADDIRVFPAHGAGSLCGKSLGSAPYTTIGAEKKSNPAFAKQTKQEFIARLTSGQPFIPKYFVHDVAVNKHGAQPYNASIQSIPVVTDIPSNALVIDTRPLKEFNSGHKKGALHIADGQSFETWIGSIVSPTEKFSMIVEHQEAKAILLHKLATIGYETNVQGVYIGGIGSEVIDEFDRQNIDLEHYAILDVRNPTEVQETSIFKGSIAIPLYELRERIEEVPTNKPVLVHCAGGYRSAIAVSILRSHSIQAYDLSTAIHTYL